MGLDKGFFDQMWDRFPQTAERIGRLREDFGSWADQRLDDADAAEKIYDLLTEAQEKVEEAEEKLRDLPAPGDD